MKRFLVKIYCGITDKESLKDKLLTVASVMKEYNLLFSKVVHERQNSMELMCVYIIYAENMEHITYLSDKLKMTGNVEVCKFTNIKEYNGILFEHNKKDIAEFIESNTNYCGELEITADKKYMLRITYYDNEILEGYINTDFDFSVDISPQIINKFEEEYGLTAVC